MLQTWRRGVRVYSQTAHLGRGTSSGWHRATVSMEESWTRIRGRSGLRDEVVLKFEIRAQASREGAKLKVNLCITESTGVWRNLKRYLNLSYILKNRK